MVHQCRHCSATYSNKYNRSRHENSAHPDELGLPVFQSSLCTFNARKLSLLEQHMRTCHGKFTNCCRTCYLGFNHVHLFAQLMSSLHGLPVFGDEFLRKDTPTESAFGGRLQTFEVVNNNDAEVNTDLARFISAEKTRIGNLVRDKLSNGPHKIQFYAKIQLLKPHRGEEDGSTDDERIEIYTNSLMTPVLNDGMSDETYQTMVDKMLTVLATFASSGSGWILEKFINLDVKFARYRPVNGFSYLPLPVKIANCRGLLNIRNHNDQNCFKYCYIAAYHLHNNISLERYGRNSNTERTSPDKYSNLEKPLGDFEMSMGFDDVKECEPLNNVQVNVFGYEKGQLYPLRVSNYESSFVMDLLLLYECITTYF